MTSKKQFTIVVTASEGDIEGPYFYVMEEGDLTEKQQTLCEYWLEKNKQDVTCEDMSASGMNGYVLSKDEKKYQKMADLVWNKFKKVKDVTPYLGSLKRLIRFFMW